MVHSDSALLSQWIKNRDASAFDQVVGRYAGLVYGASYRILRNRTDAEEVTQDCFLTLAQADSAATQHLGGWLHAVATNRAISRLRSEKRRAAREQAYARERIGTEEIEWDDLADFIDEAIENLPPDLRHAIVSSFLSRRTHDAIAEELGVARQTVSHRVKRGVEEIRKQLRHKGIAVGAVALTALLETNAFATAPPGLIANLGKIALAGPRTATTATATGPSALESIRGIWTASGMWKAGILVALLIAGGAWLLTNRATYEPAPTRPVVRANEASNAEVIPPLDARTSEATVQGPPSEQTSAETASVAESTAPVEASGIWAVVGQVLNEDGSLVAGAPVELELLKWYEHRTGYDHVRPLPDGGIRWTSVTDDHGSFRFERLPLGNYLVVAYTDMDFGMTKAVVRERWTERVFVRLRGGSTIAGVVQTANNEPVSDVRVTVLEHVPESEDSLRAPRPLSVLSASTDVNGVFLLDRLWPGKWRLHVQAAGHPELVTDPITVGTWDAKLTLGTGAKLNGDVVLARTGDPVAQAVITLRPEHGVLEYSATSDDTGAFGLDDLPAGSFSIEVAHSDYKRADGPASIDLLGGETVTDVRFVLAEGATISGRVYDEQSGEGISGVLVGAESTEINNWGFGKASSPTNGLGEYRISGLDSGEHRVRTGEAPGYPLDLFERGFAHKVVSVRQEQQVEDIDFALSKGVHVVGKVVDEGGRPVEGAIVEGTHRGGTRIDEYSVSGEDGIFELWGFPSAPAEIQDELMSFQGLYLRAHVPERERLSETIGPIQLPSEGIQHVLLTLENAASISGYVIDRSGGTLAGAQVTAFPKSAYSFGFPSAIADADGRFRLTEVKAGSYGLRVRRPGVRDASPDLEWVEVKAGQSLTNVRLTYDAGLSISGFVTDSTGTPIADAGIYARALEYSGAGKVTHSDRNGEFEIGGLLPGSHLLGGQHPEYVRTELLDVPSGTDEHHIVLEPAGILEGLITLDGSPLQGVRIEVRAANDERHMLGSANSQEDGTFEIPCLPEGEVLVRAFVVTGPDGEVYIDEQRAPLEAGAMTEIQINL